jgi:outer membrane receptor for ferrienterochelin and colicin
MKNNLLRILQLTVFYLFVGFVTQTIFINNLHASLLLEDKSLQDVKVKINGDNISLEKALQLIEQQTDFKFFYIKEDLPLNQKVKINQEEESLYRILQDFAKEYSLAFNRINNQIVVKKAGNIRLETYRVQGIVRDASTNEPLAFASVMVEGTQQGTMTDANGRFAIVLGQDTNHLRCSYVGYKTVSLAVSGQKDIPLMVRMYTIDMLLQDVTVYAHRLDEVEQTEVSMLSLQSDNIKNITSAIPDVMRSIQMLPGVSTNNEFSAKFNVRGGNQDENLVLVNSTQVYDPFHIKEASNASVGIFNTDMIQKMDLITGGFPARYGDRMSSVLNIDYREGSRDQFKGTASLSMTNFDAVIEGPLGEKGSFIVGGRKSYLEYALKMLDTDPTVNISFYDVQGVFGYSLTPQQKFLLKIIHAGDAFFNHPDRNVHGPVFATEYPQGSPVPTSRKWGDSVDAHGNYYSSMIALQSMTILSSSALVKSEISFYDQRDEENSWNDDFYNYQGIYGSANIFDNYKNEYLYKNNLRIQTLEIYSTLDAQLTSSYGIKTGASYQHINYLQDLIYESRGERSENFSKYPSTTVYPYVQNYDDNMSGNINTQSYKIAGFLENIIQLNDQLLFNVGGRFDYFDLNKDLTWSPRINAAYRTPLGIVFRGAWGYYYQSPIYRQIAYPVASDTNTQSERAIHSVLGADYDLIFNSAMQHFLKIKVEVYRKRYDNLITARQTSEGTVYYSRKNDATGDAWGIDGCVTYSHSGFYGWISYGYLTSEQRLIHDTIGHAFPRNTDQRHTLAATGEFGLGSNWTTSLRFVYGSGYAYTPEVAVKNGNTWSWVQGSPNSDYISPYKRVDLRINKDFQIFGKSASVFLDISNLFNFANVQAYRYNFDYLGNPMRQEVKLWPILPTLGMSVRF